MSEMDFASQFDELRLNTHSPNFPPTHSHNHNSIQGSHINSLIYPPFRQGSNGDAFFNSSIHIMPTRPSSMTSSYRSRSDLESIDSRSVTSSIEQRSPPTPEDTVPLSSSCPLPSTVYNPDVSASWSYDSSKIHYSGIPTSSSFSGPSSSSSLTTTELYEDDLSHIPPLEIGPPMQQVHPYGGSYRRASNPEPSSVPASLVLHTTSGGSSSMQISPKTSEGEIGRTRHWEGVKKSSPKSTHDISDLLVPPVPPFRRIQSFVGRDQGFELWDPSTDESVSDGPIYPDLNSPPSFDLIFDLDFPGSDQSKAEAKAQESSSSIPQSYVPTSLSHQELQSQPKQIQQTSSTPSIEVQVAVQEEKMNFPQVKSEFGPSHDHYQPSEEEEYHGGFTRLPVTHTLPIPHVSHTSPHASPHASPQLPPQPSSSPLQRPASAPIAIMPMKTKNGIKSKSHQHHMASTCPEAEEHPYYEDIIDPTLTIASLPSTIYSHMIPSSLEQPTLEEEKGAHQSENDDDKITIGEYTRAQRKRKIARFREKKKRMNFRKKIMYACRKEFADSRPRVGGRFVKLATAQASPSLSSSPASQKKGAKATPTPSPSPSLSPLPSSSSSSSSSSPSPSLTSKSPLPALKSSQSTSSFPSKSTPSASPMHRSVSFYSSSSTSSTSTNVLSVPHAIPIFPLQKSTSAILSRSPATSTDVPISQAYQTTTTTSSSSAFSFSPTQRNLSTAKKL